VFVVSKPFEIPQRSVRRQSLALPEEVRTGVDQAGGLAHLLEAIPPARELARDAKYHHALSDPARQKILWALSMSDLCPCLLKRITRLSDSKLSYHLRVLERAGLVRARRRANWRIYSVTSRGEEALEIH